MYVLYHTKDRAMKHTYVHSVYTVECGEVISVVLLYIRTYVMYVCIVLFVFDVCMYSLPLAVPLYTSSAGVATSTVSKLLTPTPTQTFTLMPSHPPPTPTDESAGTNKRPDQLSMLAVAIILSFVSLTFVAVTVVLLSLVVVLCLRRYRLRKKIEVRIEEERESEVDKVPPPADIVSEYDQVGQSFMASSRSMMSSVASLAHGRYEVNQTDASGPLVSGV